MDGLKPIKLEIKDKKLILGNQLLKNVESYTIRINSELPEGHAELTLKMLVIFSGNMQEQNL